MSFIDNAVGQSLALARILPIVSIGDAKRALKGEANVNVMGALAFAESKITPQVGSTLLRLYFSTLQGKRTRTFTQGEFSRIVHEINYLTRDHRAVRTERTANTTTTVVRTSGVAASALKGLEYTNWFTHKPVEGRVSSSFSGSRTVMGVTRAHKGMDFAVAVGTPVYSAGKGKVTVAGAITGYGIAVYVDHGNGYSTRYGHLSQVKVKVGDVVNGGSLIALSGNTGRSTGPHLHFEVRKGDTAEDPMQFLNALGQKTMVNNSLAAQPLANHKLESNTQVWIQTVFNHIQKSGSDDVKRCFKTKADVEQILRLEGGINSAGQMVLNARHGSFSGPFQVGVPAWIDGPSAFSPYKRPTLQQLQRLNATFAAGGPGDLAVMAPGIVRFWNNCWIYFISAARKRGLGAKLARVPRSVEMMYLLHNQGASGGIKLIATSGNPVDSGQSRDAQRVGQTVRAQYSA